MSSASDIRGIAAAGHRSDAEFLRMAVAIAGLGWAVAFVVLGLSYRLQLYGDGSMFSYAVAVQDVWAFHWHNIADRLTVFLLSLCPAEFFVAVSGSPAGGIIVYGLLFYLAPLAGLVGTWAADRSPGHTIFFYACASTALLCPLVFGFPTEMWTAHALFWPALAVAHYARRRLGGGLLSFALMLGLVLTHEAAIVLALLIVATLALRGLSDASFIRGAIALSAALMIWQAVRVLCRPDSYFADVWMRAALHFFDPDVFEVNIVLLLAAGLAGYGAAFLALVRWTGASAHLCAAAVAAMALAVYWLGYDHSIHASNRYYLRTLLAILTPVFGAAAALHALQREKAFATNSFFGKSVAALTRNCAARLVVGAFFLVTLVHAVETAKFLAGWAKYQAAVASLAAGGASDPALGDPRFVSSARIGPDLNRLAWFSTTPYLSAILTDFKPTRLVIDPKGNYFWLSCAIATANAEALRAVPRQARELVRIYSCLHRH